MATRTLKSTYHCNQNAPAPLFEAHLLQLHCRNRVYNDFKNNKRLDAKGVRVI